ncbi:MAG: low molecular weight phosphatase family protein [Microbacteriaceae bacterium]|nr:low molecular weight phosphatase family protein [Microbacteriaceae bacterium]
MISDREGASGKTRSFAILLVCTGNICRSPAAERLMISGLGHRDDITISSAGLGAMVGQPIDGPMASLLARRGVDTSSFASRSITPRMVESADLVVTMTRRQQSAVLLLVPSAGRRTFLLQELALLLVELDSSPTDASTAPESEVSGADRLRAMILLAVARRATRGAIRGLENFDIEDPYRQPERILTTCFSKIESSIDLLVKQLPLKPRTTLPKDALPKVATE